jgi:hypothetical protein
MQGRHTSEFYPQDAENYYVDDLEVIHTKRAKVGIIEPVAKRAGRVVVQTRKIPLFDRYGRVARLSVYARELGLPMAPDTHLRLQFLRSVLAPGCRLSQQQMFELDQVRMQVRRLRLECGEVWFEMLLSSSGDPITAESGRRLLMLLSPAPPPQNVHSRLVGQSVRVVARAPGEWSHLLDSAAPTGFRDNPPHAT